jgi:thiosulfate/3-mercaptopyruvate sulfurtransferase
MFPILPVCCCSAAAHRELQKGRYMKFISARQVFSSAVLILLCLSVSGAGAQRSPVAGFSTAVAGLPLIQPEELVNVLKSTKVPKPVIIQVGFHVLYAQAHIPGSEYIGPASSANGIRRLRKRVENLPHTQSLVLYCGCCPWSQCPNVNPAYKELQAMGFNNVKVLYIAHNFGTDWVDKGYPVAKGE